jgi:restriction system protein
MRRTSAGRICAVFIETRFGWMADAERMKSPGWSVSRGVEPLACLKHLSAGVSKSPAELVPVRPVLEFNMVDPRFVAESDALSELDQRPNLMELKPTEFEVLIQNLFVKMGLEARQTRPSRDGGVDCVAWDAARFLAAKL